MFWKTLISLLLVGLLAYSFYSKSDNSFLEACNEASDSCIGMLALYIRTICTGMGHLLYVINSILFICDFDVESISISDGEWWLMFIVCTLSWLPPLLYWIARKTGL